MFPFLALLCFLLALFGAHVGTLDLVLLGWAFIALSLLVGNWPVGLAVERYGRRSPPA